MMDQLTMLMMSLDDLSEAQLIEAGDGVERMAAKWRSEGGSEELGTYFDLWSRRLLQEAGARRGACQPPAAPDFPMLREAKVEELTELHRFCRLVSDSSAGDELVEFTMELAMFPVEVLLVAHDAVEDEPPPVPETKVLLQA